MPANTTVAAPAVFGRRFAPAPHGGMEATRVRLLLLERREGVRRRRAKVGRRIVCRLVHTARPKSFFTLTMKVVLGKLLLNAFALIGACIYFERTMVSSLPPEKEDHKPTQTKTNKYMSIHTYVKYFNMYKKFCGKKIYIYLRLRLQF